MLSNAVILEETPTLTHGWLDDQSIKYIILRDSNRSTVDHFTQIVTHYIKSNGDEPIHMLCDFAHLSVSLTPYFRNALEEISEYLHWHPHGGGMSIISVANPMQTTLKMFARGFGKHAHLRVEVFSSERDAFNWLSEQQI
jgi:hypothetical protein